jgi:ketosteroid isomerase-like protein
MERLRTGRVEPAPTESPADVARHLYALVTERDFEGVRQISHPDFEWRTTGLFVGMRERYVGQDGAVKCVRDFTEMWAEMNIEVVEIVDLDGAVLAHVRYRATGRDGISVDRGFAHHVTVEDGLVRKVKSWAEWDEARRALGLG